MTKVQFLRDAADLRHRAELKVSEANQLAKQAHDHGNQGDAAQAQKETIDAARLEMEAKEFVAKAEQHEHHAQALEEEAKGYESEMHDHQARIEILKQKIVETRGQ